MIKRDLVKYSKFYVELEKVELQLRDLVDLGTHLKTGDEDLLKKLDAAAEAIHKYFNEEEK